MTAGSVPLIEPGTETDCPTVGLGSLRIAPCYYPVSYSNHAKVEDLCGSYPVLLKGGSDKL